MNRKLREIETITLAMFAAVPLYATYAVSPLSVLVFHVTMTLLGIRVAMRGPNFDSLRGVIQIAGAAYLLFFPFDAAFLSRSLIRASGHLIFFIIIYQTVESSWRKNDRQRFLTTFLLFITSVATATHITVVLYIIGFALLCFRQLIRLSHLRVSEQLGLEPAAMPASRAAAAYVIPTTLIAAMLFPVLPRVRSPFVSGFTGNLGQASSGISDSIDFTQPRSISPDPEVMARVWMPRDAIPFFSPVRLRVRTYEWFDGREWRAPVRPRLRWIDSVRGRFVITRPQGFSRTLQIQQKSTRELRSSFSRLFLPVGTNEVRGVGALLGSPSANIYQTYAEPRGIVTYQAQVSHRTLPLRPESPIPVQYPIKPEIAQLARSIVGNATSVTGAAAKIETHLATKFRYVADPAELGRAISVEEFLLHERRGHCEYFAAGMVVLLTALDIPSRIVGGYYGGNFNPLAGYFVIRQRDAHAWVEVWDGQGWRTYDPTPPTLRPGSASSGLVRAYLSAVGDSVNYFWDRYILTYGLSDQITLFQQTLWRTRRSTDTIKRDLGEAFRMLLRPWLLAAIFLAAAVTTLLAKIKRRQTLFDRLLERLARLGVTIDESMTAYEVLEKLRFERPDLVEKVQPIVEVYVRDRFSAAAVSGEARIAARRALSTLR